MSLHKFAKTMFCIALGAAILLVVIFARFSAGLTSVDTALTCVAITAFIMGGGTAGLAIAVYVEGGDE